MLLKKQNSRQQLLDREIELLTASRSALAVQVNDLTAARELARKEHERESADRVAEFSAFLHGCNSQRAELLNEISSLQARRDELMKPITERIEAVAAREKACEEVEVANAARALELDALESELVGKNAEIANSKAALDEKLSKMALKEEKLAKLEAVQRQGAANLDAKWTEFRTKSSQRDAEQDERERSLELREAAVERERIFNKNELVRIENERKDVDSRRSALRAALEENKKRS